MSKNVKVTHILERYSDPIPMARLLLDCGHIATRRCPTYHNKKRAICLDCA